MTILGLIGGWLVLDNHIQTSIRKAITDPTVARELARQVRPSLIFNSEGSIIADMGALSYVEPNIGFEGTLGGRFTIVVTPTQLLSHEPVIEGLDNMVTHVVATRGPGLQWIYTVTLFGLEKPRGEKQLFRFRLEIIK